MTESAWTVYRKSSFSGVSNGCVGLSFGPNAVRIIDMKHANSPVLQVPAKSFAGLLAYVKAL